MPAERHALLEAAPDNRLAWLAREMPAFGRRTGEADRDHHRMIDRPGFDHFA